MKLASLLNSDLIFTNSGVSTREQAIEHIIQKMSKLYSFEIDEARVLELVQKREALGGTSFDSGITVAHARIENFDDLLIGICVPTKPIETAGAPIRMVVVILTNAAASTMYLNTLAAFVSLSQNESVFPRLLAAQRPEDLIETVTKLDIKVKKDLTVADIMTKNIVSVTPDTTIAELCDLFFQNSYSYVPVLDEKGDFIGEVNITDTIRLGIPDYATMIGSLNFIKTMEPFESLLKNEKTLTIKQIMKKPSFMVAEDTSILEVALEMTQNKRRHIAVVNGGKIVGIVSTMDILNKVLRG